MAYDLGLHGLAEMSPPQWVIFARSCHQIHVLLPCACWLQSREMQWAGAKAGQIACMKLRDLASLTGIIANATK